MFQNVKIGEQEVPMLAMASVDHYYQVIFHEDPVALQADGKAQTPEGTIHFLQRMGFVMAKFAALHDRKAMLQLNEEAFFEWLDDFPRGALLDALADIRAVYDGEQMPSVAAKKNSEDPSGA